ncbi:hypothetical protein LYNGBM3L_62210, partial [Moorena producens 3L]
MQCHRKQELAVTANIGEVMLPQGIQKFLTTEAAIRTRIFFDSLFQGKQLATEA